jgi:telomere length regulation protein
MEELLTPVSTSYKASKHSLEIDFVENEKPANSVSREPVQVSSPEEALEALRAEPDYSTLTLALRYLASSISSTSVSRITSPSPLSAQLVNVLVSDVVPNYWSVLNQSQGGRKQKAPENGLEKKLLLSCLRSVIGINAILTRLKALIQEVKESKKTTNGINSFDQVQGYLEVLEALLQGDQLVTFLSNESSMESQPNQKAIWREVVVLLGSGKIVSVAAEAASIANELSSAINKSLWISDGQLYSRWLTSNIMNAANQLRWTSEVSNPLSEVLSKALRLGHPGM